MPIVMRMRSDNSPGGGGSLRVARTDRLLGLLCLALLFLAGALVPASSLAVNGGSPANPAAWSSVVALLHRDQPDPFQAQFCGGTLVRQDWVLTAAHCVADRGTGTTALPETIQVGAGVTDLAAIGPEHRFDVDRVAAYPYYLAGDRSAPVAPYDLALLHLTRPVPGVTPARIGYRWYAGTPSAATAWVAGWGALDPTRSTFPDVLLTGQVSVSSRRVCEAVSGLGGVICATLPGTIEASACAGDSGGPLMDFRYEATFGAPDVIGIVSFGPEVCGQGRTTRYTDVGLFHSWIAWVSRAGDPAIAQPEIGSVTGRDLGRVIELRAKWCQLGGRGHSVRVDFILDGPGRVPPGKRWFMSVGRAPGNCSVFTRRVPDIYPNGRWRLSAKVIDRTTTMTDSLEDPAIFRIRG